MSSHKYLEQQRLFQLLDESSRWTKPVSHKSAKPLLFEIDMVRRLFFFLQLRKQQIRCYLGASVYPSLIIGMRQNLALLYIKNLSGLESRELRSFDIEFYYADLKYQFNVIIFEVYGDYVYIYIPDEIQSTKRRKTERIFTNKLFIRFTLAYPPFPEIPFRNSSFIDLSLYGTYAHIIEELMKDDPKISSLYMEVSKQIEKMGFRNDLRIYPAPKQGAFDRLDCIGESIKREKKIFFIADSRKIESYFIRPDLEILTNAYGIYEDLEKESPGEGINYCQEVQNKDKENFIRSYACLPLLLFDSVIGYIKVFSTIFDQQSISQEEAKSLDLLSQFLNYGIMKSLITQKYHYRINVQIKNISRGGLFFEISDKRILDYLIQHIYLKITLEIRGQVLHVKGRVVQYYIEKDIEKYGIGLQFYSKDPDTDIILEDLIYEGKRNKLQAYLN